MRRAFAEDGDRQIHYRHAGREQDGATLPLLLIHGCPGSARQLAPLIGAMSETRWTIAPDLAGLGDSDPLPHEEPDIVDYAATLLRFADQLDLQRFDIYGTHTGAAVAAEIAILAPDRVGRLILDGVACFDEATAAEFLAQYAPSFTPDLEGAYLQRAFQFCRDQMLFFPWYDRRAETRRPCGLMPPEVFHPWLMEVLKAGQTYNRAYRAAFRWQWRQRLSLVARPVLVTAPADDPLAAMTQDATGLLPDGRWVSLPAGGEPGFSARRTTVFTDYLGAR